MSAQLLDIDEKPQTDAKQTNKETEVVEYPSNQKRILIMTAVYLAAFLVTLVSPFFSREFLDICLITNFGRTIGPKHYIYCYSPNH
jgi:hypothetical protein